MAFSVQLANYCNSPVGPIAINDDYGFIIKNGLQLFDINVGFYTPAIVRHNVHIEVDGVSIGKVTSRAKKFGNNFVSEVRVDQFIADYCKTDRQGYFLDFTYDNTTGGNSNAVAEQVEPVHTTDKFCPNKENLRRITFTFSVETQRLVTSDILTQPQSAVTGFSQFTGEKGFQEFFWNAINETDASGELYLPTINMLTASNKRVLSPILQTINRKVFVGTGSDNKASWWTVGVFNGYFNSTNSSNVKSCRIDTFDSSGTLQASYSFQNDFYDMAEDTSVGFPRRGLLYVGVGPKNLINSGTMTLANFNNIAYYEIYFRDNFNQQTSHKYRFDIISPDCKGFRPIQLAYINSLGVWDYYIFNKKSTATTEIERSKFELNNRFNDGQGFNNFNQNYNELSGGVKTFNVVSYDTILANSDFMSSKEAYHLKELFHSPEVHMYEYRDEVHSDGSVDHKWIPVTVEEKEYVAKNSPNDKLVQYEIAIKYSHKNRIQGL